MHIEIRKIAQVHMARSNPVLSTLDLFFTLFSRQPLLGTMYNYFGVGVEKI